MKYVLITRPIERAKNFVERLTGINIPTLLAPVLRYTPLLATPPNDDALSEYGTKYDALIFTSQYGVKTFERLPPPQIPVFAVGSATAFKAISTGFNIVHNADGNADDLSRLLAQTYIPRNIIGGKTAGKYTPKTPARLLHVCGVHSHDIPVPRPNIKITRRAAYDMKEIDTLPDNIVDNIRRGDIDTIPFFSKRSAQHFMALVERHNLSACLPSINALCISDSVLKCVQHGNWRFCAATPHPSSDAMIDAILKHRIDTHE